LCGEALDVEPEPEPFGDGTGQAPDTGVRGPAWYRWYLLLRVCQ
jgi:hypothetical protein